MPGWKIDFVLFRKIFEEIESPRDFLFVARSVFHAPGGGVKREASSTI
jgi:hypothetical protein